MDAKERRAARAAAAMPADEGAAGMAAIEGVAAAPRELPAGAAAPAAGAAERTAETARAFGEEALAAVGEAQAAVARGLEEMTVEITGMARAGITAATETASAMLSIKTVADALEVNAVFARQSIDALIGGSAKLSEIGVRVAAEASRPILAQFGKGWPAAGA